MQLILEINRDLRRSNQYFNFLNPCASHYTPDSLLVCPLYFLAAPTARNAAIPTLSQGGEQQN